MDSVLKPDDDGKMLDITLPRWTTMSLARRLEVTQIDALLPQTQCTKCKYPGCRPYAEAISEGAAINRCVPGGHEVIQALAELTGRPALPLDPDCGQTLEGRLVAFIREEECIGCTKCIQACPVDAIIGASGYMHTVLADDCTGCDLCVAPCPVDCIDMLLTALPRLPSPEEAQRWRQRHEQRQARLDQQQREKTASRPKVMVSQQAALTVAAALARHELKKFLRQYPEASDPTWQERRSALEIAVQQAEAPLKKHE